MHSRSEGDPVVLEQTRVDVEIEGQNGSPEGRHRAGENAGELLELLRRGKTRPADAPGAGE